MIFKTSLHGKAPFLMAVLLFANGCTYGPQNKIVNAPAAAPVHAKSSRVQIAPSNSWPPVSSSSAPIQFGSPDVVPPPRTVVPPAPVIAPLAVKPVSVAPLPLKPEPPEIKKQEIKTGVIKKEEPKKESEKPKPSVSRESKATSYNNKPAVNFLSRFEGINWGDAPKPDMNRIEENKEALETDVSAYTIDRDDAPAFGLKPGMIIYYFKENRFNKVEMIWEPDETEYSILEKNVLTFFGEPIEAEVLGSRRWINSPLHLTVQFSDANATKAHSPGYLMSLVVERIV